VRYRTTLAEDHANATVNRYLAVLSHAVLDRILCHLDKCGRSVQQDKARAQGFTIHKQLFELSDDLATRITAVFYSDAREAFIKAIADA
jgi:hypothetical protein